MNNDKLFDSEFSYKIHPKDVARLKDYLIQKQGWVYIAYSKNNNLFKIGRTGKNPLFRAKTLSSSGVLHDYEILFSLKFFNQFIAEKNVHQSLKKYRINKEFFAVSEELAIQTLDKEYQKEKTLLNRFFDTKMVEEDIELLEHALK